MKKKIISILLCTAMLFTLSFSSSGALFAAETADGQDGGTPPAAAAAKAARLANTRIPGP